MRQMRIERTTPAALALAACVALFGTFAAVGQAHARVAGGQAIHGRSGPPAVLNSAPAIQPHFNPSVPYTVPQSPETPVSPGSPGSVFGPR